MSERILVVDDDEAYLTAVRRLLEHAGYHVRCARSADQARAQLRVALPDLILLDVIMPAEDGFLFAESLARQEGVSDVPVVLVTAVADNAGQALYAFEQDKGLTAHDVLAKSQISEKLLDCVASALQRSKGASANRKDT